MMEVRAIRKVADSSATVSLRGEPEQVRNPLLARFITILATRRTIVGVSCTALPENLIEAELFDTRRALPALERLVD